MYTHKKDIIAVDAIFEMCERYVDILDEVVLEARGYVAKYNEIYDGKAHIDISLWDNEYVEVVWRNLRKGYTKHTRVWKISRKEILDVEKDFYDYCAPVREVLRRNFANMQGSMIKDDFHGN